VTAIFTGGVGNKVGLFFPQGLSVVPKGAPIVPGNYPVTGVRAPPAELARILSRPFPNPYPTHGPDSDPDI